MWRQVVAQSPGENAADAEVLRYDIGWKALNTMLKSGRSLSGNERNCAFLNTGGDGARFADISAAAGIDFVDDGRVVAMSDWDHDGDLDFWIANRTAPQVRFLRNNTDATNQALQFKLIGTKCNRDAIGAKVELKLAGGGGIRLRTMRSGGAYLGQSSSWLHFGLGKKAAAIEGISVLWPDGQKELVAPTAIAADGRYVITQGDGKAVPAKSARAKVLLTERGIDLPAPNGQSRIVMITPPPIPAMSYKDSAGAEQAIVDAQGKTKLVTLWASWCAPCLAELKEWGAQSKALADSGVEVLAINVEAEADRTKAQAAWTKLGLPFKLGYGAEEIARQFDVLQRAVLSRQRPLPLPSSFLIDAEGNLRVIYKGPVSAEQVAADARLVGAPLEKILESAVPFPGKWLGQPAGTSPNAIAVRFVEGGYVKEAEEFLRLLTETKNQHPTFKPVDAHTLLGAILLDQDRLDEAAAALTEAVELAPYHRAAHIELAGIRMRQKQSTKAVPHYLAALEKRQDDPDLHFKLGMAYADHGAAPEAIDSLTKSIALRPALAAHQNLGNLLLGQGKVAEALEQFEAALKFNPNFIAAANNVAWLRSAHPDEALRDPARAIELAERVCKQPNGRTASHLDTLAVAYAADGRFEKAVEAARDSIKLAKAAGDLVTAKEVQGRLELYQQNQPYRDQ